MTPEPKTLRPMRSVIQLALPMAVTQLLAIGSSFLCMTMLASLGREVLAASALIFSINMSVSLIFFSLLFSLCILISHANGEQKYESIGILYQQGLVFALLVSLGPLLIFWYIYPILIFFKQDPALAKIVENFFHATIWRVVPFFLAVCNQQLCYGVHKQRIDLYANVLGVFALVVSAYIFIFGKFGLPAMGVAGFGYAAVLQGLTYLVFSTTCLCIIPDFKKFRLYQFRILKNLSYLKQMLVLGWPISVQIGSEMISFLLTATLIGWLGVNALAAYQVVMQYQFLMVIPIFAMSQASGIIVGQAYGAKQFSHIKLLGKASAQLVATVSIIMGCVILLFPKKLASVYLDVNQASNAPIMHLVYILFVYVVFAQFFDGMRNVMTGCLRGLLDTRYTMFASIFCIWILYLPLGYLLAFPWHLGVTGIFFAWTISLLLGAVLVYRRWCFKTAVLY